MQESMSGVSWYILLWIGVTLGKIAGSHGLLIVRQRKFHMGWLPGRAVLIIQILNHVVEVWVF